MLRGMCMHEHSKKELHGLAMLNKNVPQKVKIKNTMMLNVELTLSKLQKDQQFQEGNEILAVIKPKYKLDKRKKPKLKRILKEFATIKPTAPADCISNTFSARQITENTSKESFERLSWFSVATACRNASEVPDSGINGIDFKFLNINICHHPTRNLPKKSTLHKGYS